MRPTLRYEVSWKFSDELTTVHVDESARRFYRDEHDADIAAELACLECQRPRSEVRDVKEV